ncbi:titin [Plakobranchus ocellatus]|uniref:Titin n=1 Tax=Plakobranchus ocellatus TaxID=259542 RepID=A0AAV4CXN0_9GAST|nr:titin [Plakobranchus ocellatus]
MSVVASYEIPNQWLFQISWQKVGKEHLLSIGTEVWVKDHNLEIKHQMWPANVGDWNLVFHEARLNDSGVYECQVISTDKLTRRVRLSVVGELMIHFV